MQLCAGMSDAFIQDAVQNRIGEKLWFSDPLWFSAPSDISENSASLV